TYKIKEGDKERLQVFQGIVIQKRGGNNTATETFTVRKVSGTVGVERIFPMASPLIEELKVMKHGKVRRARIFYQRERTGKSARIRDRKRF
ncbi:50S ribosomal protein L19, partial [Flavobacteriales bacterium]|nr:50S ribosomal protein L19 [Flavobacteriales bacterium]